MTFCLFALGSLAVSLGSLAILARLREKTGSPCDRRSVRQATGPLAAAIGARVRRSPSWFARQTASLRLRNDDAAMRLWAGVTARRESAALREAENKTLERRVRERTEDLERLNAALVKAKAEAEEANISKTRFLAAASHDLLQPLNAARLYATSLKERVRARAPLEDSLILASNVEDSIEAVEDILTTLLDISALDAGATKIEMTVFRVGDIFRQLQVEFGPIARDKGLALTFVWSSVPVRSDWRLLRRLLQNLISNAIKYTAQGRIIVGVRRDGPQVCLQVWDTGVGIPKCKQRVIFREFERLPNPALHAPGIGLGLSIVERLGRVLSHEIEVRSKPGRGSVFSVLLPRAAETDLRRAVNPSGVVVQPRSLAGLVIVAVDDKPAILAGMEALLGGWGCTVVTGVDLDAAQAALSAYCAAPNVIIADYHLGEIDGIATITALRARYGPCHAVLVTADRSPLVRGLACAADICLLNKPLKPAVLRAVLSQWRLVKVAAE